MESLPPELVEADARLHRLLTAIRFSRHLNPLNVGEARAVFARGAEVPPFRYAPADWAGDALAELDALRIPGAHPLGAELKAAAEEVRAWVVALRDRTAEAFDALAAVCGWAPAADGPEVDEGAVASRDTPFVPVEALEAALRAALRQRGLRDWTVHADAVMSSRVLVDAARREVRVNPAARFRAGDADALVAHEIDVHVTRGENGRAQALSLFETGLAGNLPTEEGLALVAEQRAAGLPRGFLARQRRLAVAIADAGQVGFRELYEGLAAELGAATAWNIALRVKRGLADPGAPGVYAKDAVYLSGWLAVRRWLAEGGDIADLYVGKVGLQHPVAEWRRAGWVGTGRVPALWLTPR